MSTGAFKLRRHLLGPDRIGHSDGGLGGEEFQCAFALDGLEEVAVWVRNLPRQAYGFWLPTSRDRFWPDFVARLADGRLFVVEYKGAPYVANAAEDRLVGRLWAERTGNRFVMVEGYGLMAPTRRRRCDKPYRPNAAHPPCIGLGDILGDARPQYGRNVRCFSSLRETLARWGGFEPPTP